MALRRRTTVELDNDLLDWVKENFPDVGLWTVLNGLLRSLKEEYEKTPPVNYYLLGARNLRDQLNKDLSILDKDKDE